MRSIGEEEVRAVLGYEALIPAVRQGLVDYSAGRVQQPARTVLRVGASGAESGGGTGSGAGGWFAVMPVAADGVMAVKTVTFFPGNAALGKPTHLAMIELLDGKTGEPLAVMDGRVITEMRTAAVSAVALDALGRREGLRSLGILGSGVQARAHVEALRRVRPELEEVRIWSRTRGNAERLAAEVGARAVEIEEAAAADVVVTATGAREPVLRGEWLGENALVLAVGAVGGELRELDDRAMLESVVIAESRDGVERESGDVRLSGARVFAEIGEILMGKVAVPEGRVVFKSVGMAVEDLVGARLVLAARANAPLAPFRPGL
jgi:thiomorpholine-carboxylate dehydrogenase